MKLFGFKVLALIASAYAGKCFTFKKLKSIKQK